VHLIRSERGSAIVTSLLVMVVLLAFGITILDVVDVQQRESGRERARESSFQLTEGALNGQIFQLSRRWPGSDDSPYPTSCTMSSTAADCPAPASMRNTFTNVDYGSDTVWSTQVRDNGGAYRYYYSDAVINTQPRWDQNDDEYMWVRAEGVVRDRRRVLVALVKADSVPLDLPQATLVAGRFWTTNSGNKTIIDTNGVDEQFAPGAVVVRCPFNGQPPPVAGCADYDNTKQRKQVEPDTTASDPSLPPGLGPEELDTLRTLAASDGNYYTGCPNSLEGDQNGEVVFIEDAGSNCTFQSNAVYNAPPPDSGFVIIGRGKITIMGTADFHGILYHANLDNSSDVLIDLGGNVSIFGGIIVDGPGGVYAGSS
jgi:hypothetical protein